MSCSFVSSSVISTSESSPDASFSGASSFSPDSSFSSDSSFADAFGSAGELTVGVIERPRGSSPWRGFFLRRRVTFFAGALSFSSDTSFSDATSASFTAFSASVFSTSAASSSGASFSDASSSDATHQRELWRGPLLRRRLISLDAFFVNFFAIWLFLRSANDSSSVLLFMPSE